MAKAKRPQIEPARFTGQLAGINTLLNAIREQIQIDQGDRGDPLDRAVKIRDLTDAGVTEFLLSKRGNGQYASVVAPAGNQLNLSAPPNPENLQANPTTATVYLTWDAPNYPYHAYTEVWRNTEDNLSTAIDLGARPAYRYYADPVDSGRTYYYWIRFVTHAGKKSDYNAVDGVSATTNLDPSVVLETLNDKITSSQLVKNLRDNIELIPSVASNIEIANELLESTQKKVKSFQSAQSIESLVGIDTRELKILARVSNEETTRIQQYQELSSSFQTLKSTSSAEVIRLDEAIANESEARASAIVTLTAQFENNLGVTRDAAVEEAINIITTDDDVIAEVITKISAADTANWATTAYVTQAKTDLYNSQVSQFGNISAKFESQQSEIDARATLDELNEITAGLEDASIKQTSQALTSIKQADFNAQTQYIKNIEQSSKADRSQMTRYERMESEYKTGLSATKASIAQLSETISTESTARATAIAQISTTINGQTATLEQQAESIDGLRANWAVKFQIDDDGVKRISGFGLSADGESTGAHFDVDQFSISKPGAEKLDLSVADVLQPDGTTKRMVVMDAASLINLVVTNAMIENISADKITAGKIDAQFIDTESLVANKAQSPVYIPGENGWDLREDGSVEFNNGTYRGQLDVKSSATGSRIEITGDRISVYEGGSLRVRMGRL